MIKIPFEIKDSKTHCKIFWKNGIFGNIRFLPYGTCVIIKKGLETRFPHMEKWEIFIMWSTYHRETLGKVLAL